MIKLKILTSLQSITHRDNRVLTADHILIYLRSRPHKELLQGIELKTGGRQLANQTTEQYRRPHVYLNHGISTI